MLHGADPMACWAAGSRPRADGPYAVYERADRVESAGSGRQLDRDGPGGGANRRVAQSPWRGSLHRNRWASPSRGLNDYCGEHPVGNQRAQDGGASLGPRPTPHLIPTQYSGSRLNLDGLSPIRVTTSSPLMVPRQQFLSSAALSRVFSTDRPHDQDQLPSPTRG